MSYRLSGNPHSVTVVAQEVYWASWFVVTFLVASSWITLSAGEWMGCRSLRSQNRHAGLYHCPHRIHLHHGFCKLAGNARHRRSALWHSVGAPKQSNVLGLTPQESWGVFQTLTTAYASEVCPIQLRGYLTAYVNLCWGVGILLSSGVVKATLPIAGDWSEHFDPCLHVAPKTLTAYLRLATTFRRSVGMGRTTVSHCMVLPQISLVACPQGTL